MLTSSFLFNKLAALQSAHSRLVSVDALFTIFSHTHAHYDDIHKDDDNITTTAVIVIFNIQHTQFGDVCDLLTDTNITILIVTITVLGNRYVPR